MRFFTITFTGLFLAIPPIQGQDLQGTASPTQLDNPSAAFQTESERLREQRKLQRKARGRLAKIDLDGDFNYDGTIQDDDPEDNGEYQRTPPGLIIGKDELSKLVLRLTPYGIDFTGSAVVSMEIAGINRHAVSGEFESFQDEVSRVGRVRIWTDASRKTLLLDSADPQRRYIEWVLDSELFPANIAHTIPKTVYAEGVKSSDEFLGDLRVLLTISRRAPQNETERKGFLSRFRGAEETPEYRTVFDHILLTVADKPHKKDYVNDNRENVWLIAKGPINHPTPSGKK